jgi:hypothetical protein
MEGLVALEKKAFWATAGRALWAGLKGAKSLIGGTAKVTGKVAKIANGKPGWMAKREANALKSAGKMEEAKAAAKSGIGWKGAVGWTVGPMALEKMIAPGGVNTTEGVAGLGGLSYKASTQAFKPITKIQPVQGAGGYGNQAYGINTLPTAGSGSAVDRFSANMGMG